jgi:cleavage stimulation factor subunit 2
LSEEQIQDIFSGAGKVLNFRLVYDRETGKPKGFGFAEYPDNDSAASAVRNLNDYEIMGRKLRVDFSNEQGSGGDDDGKDGTRSGQQNGHRHTGSTTQAGAGLTRTDALPPLPPGKDLPPGVTATDAISRTLNTLPPSQLLDILTQMKQLASNDPARATQLLAEAPQLSYAVFQALLLLGLVSPEAISSVIETSGSGVAPTPAPVPPPAAFSYPGVGATATPPVAVGGYAPPPPAPVAAPQPAANPLAALTAPAGGDGAMDPAALMQAVMDLPQAMIDQLPDGEKQQIMALRASYGQAR